jgi:diguanylate cyclase (GGDEF)-like protein
VEEEMTILEATALLLRRGAETAGGLVFAGLFGVLIATGFFATPPDQIWSAGRIAAFLAWIVVFGWRAHRHLRALRRRGQLLRELDVGLLLVVLTYGVVDLSGGLEGAYYPLVYMLVALLVSFLSWRPVAIIVAVALGFEALAFLLPWPPATLHTFAVHGLFILSFASLNFIFTRTEILRLRRSGEHELQQQLSDAEQTARDFRLLAAPSTTVTDTMEPTELARRRALSAVLELRQSVYYSLDLLKASMQLHTAALLWLDGEGRLKIAELASDSEQIAEGPFATSPGVLGAALASGKTVNLHQLRGQLAHQIPYYSAPSRVGCLLAVPVEEKGITRGVLCADRREGEAPFGAHEERALRAAARHLVQCIENERVFVALERAKAEQTKLYRASEALGMALTEEDAMEAVLSAAQGIVACDLATVTLYNRQTRRHRVVRAVGEGSKQLQELSFRDNAGMASMALKNRHYLPYRGQYDARRQVVFTRSTRLKGMESLLILPLVAQDVALGTLTLAAKKTGVFTDTVRRTLQVLTNQMATSVTNARMVRRLKEMATTDGLTGLLNHRVFQEELERKLKSAGRFGRPLSVILTDLDKFKTVNDTHGHPVGDQVLKGYAQVLERAMRETDLVARYGGEEFAVICEQTDETGAEQLAHRIREEMAAQLFQSDSGEFQVTCSLGIATYPTHGSNKASLVEAADQALYQAKENGRNRVEIAKEGHGNGSRSAPSPGPAPPAQATLRP